MAIATVTLRMDADFKRDLEGLFDDLGMSINTAFMVFAKAAMQSQGLPFKVKRQDNPFAPGDEARILHAWESYKAGEKGRTFTAEEWEAMIADADD